MHYIFYVNKIKMAKAINSKEEYFNLRNSEENRRNLALARQGDEEAKRRLVQFAYNDLMPDGKVAGCCHPSGMFAYDVDCENYEESTRIAQQIIARKQEIGLLEVSRSARFGLHLILIREQGKTILENQVRISLLTKTEMDTGAHDLGRVMFTTTADADELLYLDEAIFHDNMTVEESENEFIALTEREKNRQEQVPAGAKKANKHYRPWEDGSSLPTTPSITTATEQPMSAENSAHVLNPCCLRAFDMCMEEAGLTEKALQVEGVRHNSLLSIFSVGACRLISQEQMRLVVKERMPEYVEERDCQQLISDFYQNYTELNKPLTKRLREIHAEAYGEDGQDDHETEEAGVEESQKKRQLNVNQLPSGLKEPVVMAPEPMRMNVLCAMMPIAAAYADQVEVEYADNKRQHLGLMSLVIGRQAGGKSCAKEAVETWMGPLKEEAAEARRQEDAIKQKNKLRKANERAQEIPQLPIRKVPITISCSTLLKRFKYAPGHTLYSFGEELDTLLKTNSAGNWSAKYDVYRLSFDRGEWGQDYNSDQAESGEVNAAYNWTIFGTYGAFNRCFRAENVENGLAGRVLMSEMPDTRFSKIPKYKPLTQQQTDAIRQATELLRNKVGFVDTPRLRKAIDKWLEEKRLEAMKDMNETMDELRKRSAVIAFRCAVVFHLLTGKERESKACVDFMLMMADYTLENQMKLLSKMMEDQQMLNTPTTHQKLGNVTTFDNLPQVFTMADVKSAKGAGYADSTYRNIISRWNIDGFVEEVPREQWGSKQCQQWRKKITA